MADISKNFEFTLDIDKTDKENRKVIPKIEFLLGYLQFKFYINSNIFSILVNSLILFVCNIFCSIYIIKYTKISVIYLQICFLLT